MEITMENIIFSGLALTIGLCVSPIAKASEHLAVSTTNEYKVDIAESLQKQLLDPVFKQRLLGQFKQTNGPILFSNLMADKMSNNTQQVLDIASTQGIYPEIWLHSSHTKSTADSDSLLIAYAPQGEEKQWSYIPAIEVATGEPVQLEVNHAPEVPVLVVETHGKYSMQHFITDLNTRLQDLSDQPMMQNKALSQNVMTSQLTKISLQDDEEPWIKGGAEIFTFVAGVFDNNTPSIKAVGLPYLDHDKTDYYPNQILVNWRDFKYNAVNLSIYEEDSQTNYKELAKTIVTAVGAIGSLAGFEPATAIAQITNRIQDAMPDSWYTDDHDYVDTCYTLVKGQNLNDQWCAARNAKISIRPFELMSN